MVTLRAYPAIATWCFAWAVAALFAPTLAQAKPPAIAVRSDSALRFGTFMVFGSGSRTIAADGTLRDQSIVALEGAPTGPARFTISYDRGNESRQVLAIDAMLVVSAAAPVRQEGVEARLNQFEIELPGERKLVTPGQPITVRIRNCSQRVCSLSFALGGRLEVTRRYGGAELSLPVPVDISVLSVNRHAN